MQDIYTELTQSSHDKPESVNQEKKGIVSLLFLRLEIPLDADKWDAVRIVAPIEGNLTS